MARTMTPSAKSKIITTITTGQINQAVDRFRTMLEKHAPEFQSGPVQIVLSQFGFTDEVFAVFRRRVEAETKMIVRRVRVDPGRTSREALSATGRTGYADPKVVDEMPKGKTGEVEVVFFKPEPQEYTRPGYMSDDDLERAFGRRGLKPADPFSVTAVNEADPTFADERPNSTHWKKEADGKWCFITFDRWRGERGMHVRCSDEGWDSIWWFAGLRK